MHFLVHENQMFCFGDVIFEKSIRHFRRNVWQVVLSSRERSGICIFKLIFEEAIFSHCSKNQSVKYYKVLSLSSILVSHMSSSSLLSPLLVSYVSFCLYKHVQIHILISSPFLYKKQYLYILFCTLIFFS